MLPHLQRVQGSVFHRTLRSFRSASAYPHTEDPTRHAVWVEGFDISDFFTKIADLITQHHGQRGLHHHVFPSPWVKRPLVTDCSVKLTPHWLLLDRHGIHNQEDFVRFSKSFDIALPPIAFHRFRTTSRTIKT